jgi:hypothetical protein
MLTSINLFGGPGTGKSTTAALVFGNMKQKHYNVELITEYAKTRVYEEHWSVFPDQIYIFAKMLRQYNRFAGKVDFVVSECPLLLSVVYARYMSHDYVNFEPLVVEAVSKMNNINIMLTRTVPYQPKGRNQDLEEAERIDCIVRDVLTQYNQNIIELPVDDNTVTGILNMLPSNGFK